MVETPVIRPMRVFMLATMSVAFFSVMNVFVKLAAESHSIIEIMFFRNALGIIPVTLLIVAHHEQFDLLKTRRIGGHMIRGAIGMASMTCFFWSFKLLPLADATAIQFAMPILLTALSVPFLGEKVGPWRWGAVVVGFIGILVIAAPTGNTDVFGSMVALAGAALTAVTMMIVRRLGRTEHPNTIVFYFSLMGATISACFLPWYWTPPSLSSFVYLVLCGLAGGCAQVFATKAYAEAPAAYVSPFNYVSILFATFFGWAIWGNVPERHVLIGAGIVIASGLFILYRETVMKKNLVTEGVMEAGQAAAGVTYNPEAEEKTQ